jgi:hypothetical protein
MPQCSFHPDVETEMSCAECGRAICPKEMVLTPVGYKCPVCAKPKKSQYTYIKPRQLLSAIAISAVVGVGGAFLLHAFIGRGSFFGFFIGYGWGMLTAEAARRGSGGHRGRELAIVAAVALIVGGLLAGLPLLIVGIAVFGAASTLAWSWSS